MENIVRPLVPENYVKRKGQLCMFTDVQFLYCNTFYKFVNKRKQANVQKTGEAKGDYKQNTKQNEKRN